MENQPAEKPSALVSVAAANDVTILADKDHGDPAIAAHLESQLPELRDAFTMVWARSGGGEVRSEAGRKLRTALIIERAAMHAGERPRRDYEGDKPLMRIMAKMPEKAGLYERLTGAQPVVATSEPLPVMARRTPQA